MAINPAIAKLGNKALNKAVTKAEAQNKPLAESGFKQMLDNAQSAEKFAENLGISSSKIEPTGNMQELSANNVSFDPEVGVGNVEKPEMSGKIVDMLADVNKSQIQMDNLVNQVLYSQKKFQPQELLAIQASVQQLGLLNELAVKIAEHTVSSTKQVLNTQVQ